MHECFKFHGYPEWYKRYNNNKGKTKVNYVDNTQEEDHYLQDGERVEGR